MTLKSPRRLVDNRVPGHCITGYTDGQTNTPIPAAIRIRYPGIRQLIDTGLPAAYNVVDPHTRR